MKKTVLITVLFIGSLCSPVVRGDMFTDAQRKQDSQNGQSSYDQCLRNCDGIAVSDTQSMTYYTACRDSCRRRHEPVSYPVGPRATTSAPSEMANTNTSQATPATPAPTSRRTVDGRSDCENLTAADIRSGKAAECLKRFDHEMRTLSLPIDCLTECDRVYAGPERENCRRWCFKKYGGF